MVWACMTWEGVGNLRLVEGNMDKHVYHEIWYSIEVDIVRKLIMSVPKRVANVYQAKGSYTRW